MKIETIPIEKITSNPMQPREKFDREKLEELSKSIKAVGLKVPIIVRPKGKQYELVSGQRRWEAAKAAKVKKLTAIIKELDDKELAVESLIANEFRENLDPWERAKFLKRIKKTVNSKNDVELGQLVGMSKGAISAAWRYLEVDEEVRVKVVHGRLDARTAREIASIPDKKTQRKIADIAEKQDMTVKQAEELISVVKKAPEPIKRAVLKEKIDTKDVKPLVDYGIPKKMEKSIVDEMTKRKEERKKIQKFTKEVDMEVIKGRRKPTTIKIDRSADENRLRKFEETRDTVQWWTMTMVDMIKTEEYRKDAVKCIRAIRNHCDILLRKLDKR